MFEKFTSENIENFRQRYEGTYGFYRDEKHKRLLVKLAEINDSHCQFVDANDIWYEVFPNVKRDIGFEFLPPKSQWYNTSNGPMMTQRVASRQFQRGITGKNIEIHALQEGTLVPQRVDFKNLSAIFESSAKATKELLDKHLGKRGVAISPEFALAPNGAVWLYRDHIGVYSRTGDKFTMKLDDAKLWRTEITDALQAIGCTTEIV